jgi:hypothetical protein
MSTTPSRPPGQTSPGSTRQLLDELDALMQRMLALPVNQLEDDATLPQAPAILPAPPREERRSNAEGESAGNTPTGQAGTSALDARSGCDAGPARNVMAHPPAAIFPQLPHRSEATTPGGSDAERFTPPDEPAVIIPPGPETSAAPVGSPVPAPLPRPSLRPAAAPGMSPVGLRLMPPAPAAPSPSHAAGRLPGWLLRPLLWSNRAFDRWTGWLGRPGRWLRGPLGRKVLGWVGLGLWAIALTLLVWRILG